jgi:hypothetical protein
MATSWSKNKRQHAKVRDDYSSSGNFDTHHNARGGDKFWTRSEVKTTSVEPRAQIISPYSRSTEVYRDRWSKDDMVETTTRKSQE